LFPPPGPLLEGEINCSLPLAPSLRGK